MAQKLTPSQRALLARLSRHGVAFKGATGWRLRGDRAPVLLATGNRLIELGLARELSQGAPARLVLTETGKATAEKLAARNRRQAPLRRAVA